MVLAVSTFACLDAVSKFLTAHYPVPAIVWVRYIFQTFLMLLVLAPRLGTRLVRTASLKLQLVRSFSLIAAGMLFVVAISLIPLAAATSIVFMAPVIIALLAGPLLHERVTPHIWVALAAGTTGVMLIIRPGSTVFSWAALLPLGCAFMMATYQIATRKLVGRDPALTSLFYPGLVACFAIPLVFPSAILLPAGALHVGLFALTGVLGAVGHFFLIRATDYAPISTLAPFQYTQLLVVLLLGWLLFGELPDALAALGMLVICAGGLLLVFRPGAR